MVRTAALMAAFLCLIGQAGCHPRVVPSSPLPRLGHRIELASNISVFAEEVRAVGRTRRAVFGIPLIFTEFLVRARLYEQICEDFDGRPGCRVPGPARTFRVSIASDSTGPVCSAFLSEVLDYWRAKDTTYLNNFYSLPTEKYAYLESGTFVLTDEPLGDHSGPPWLLYAPPTLVRIALEPEPSWPVGYVASFVEDDLDVWLGYHNLGPREPHELSPRLLIAMIERGVFRCPT
jgi:hypothetical protein